MIYKILYNKKVKKFIEKQAKDQRIRIYEAINKLPDGDVKKMQQNIKCKQFYVGTVRNNMNKKYHFSHNRRKMVFLLEA